MLRMFGRKKVFGVPASFLNAVAGWMLGVHSESGTVKVTNDVTGERGPSLDVDPERLVREARDAFAVVFLKRGDATAVDGVSVLTLDGKFEVSEEWVLNLIKQHVAPGAWID